jgi:hypothetical protein
MQRSAEFTSAAAEAKSPLTVSGVVEAVPGTATRSTLGEPADCGSTADPAAYHEAKVCGERHG